MVIRLPVIHVCFVLNPGWLCAINTPIIFRHVLPNRMRPNTVYRWCGCNIIMPMLLLSWPNIVFPVPFWQFVSMVRGLVMTVVYGVGNFFGSTVAVIGGCCISLICLCPGAMRRLVNRGVWRWRLYVLSQTDCIRPVFANVWAMNVFDWWNV